MVRHRIRFIALAVSVVMGCPFRGDSQDIDGNGFVDAKDLLSFQKYWHAVVNPGGSLWISSGPDIYYPSGNVAIGRVPGPFRQGEAGFDLQIEGNAGVNGAVVASGGFFAADLTSPVTPISAELLALPAGGELRLDGSSRHMIAKIGPLYGSSDIISHGTIDLNDGDGRRRLGLQVDEYGQGEVSVSGASGFVGALIKVNPGIPSGEILTFGPNGHLNVRLSAMNENRNYGFVGVSDSSGQDGIQIYVDPSTENGVIYARSKGANKAGITVDSHSRGVVWSDLASSVVENPEKPSDYIVYNSLEGPEAGVYVRGIGRLIEGRGVIELPEHFHVKAEPGTMTVQLTPRSLGSRGVGFEIGEEGRIVIGELNGGTGSYEVDYVVHAGRRGFGDLKVVHSGIDLEKRGGMPVVSQKTDSKNAPRTEPTPGAEEDSALGTVEAHALKWWVRN